MRDREVQVGSLYWAKVSGRVVPVRVVGRSPIGRRQWWVRNLITGRETRVSAQRLRRPVLPGEPLEVRP